MPKWDQIPAWLYYIVGLIDFHSAVHLKYSSFWPSADVKPMSNYLVHAMLWYGMVWYGMLWYGMLCYAMLCYAMLCYAMLCYAMLCYAMLCYAMLCYAMLCYYTPIQTTNSWQAIGISIGSLVMLELRASALYLSLIILTINEKFWLKIATLMKL